MSTNSLVIPGPFTNITGGRRGEEISASQRLKIAIMGLSKSGKSNFAATAPGPILYYDHDDRAESLEGKLEGSIIKSKPSMLDIEADLSILKANKIKGLPLPTTIVHDSVTYMKIAMEQEILRQDRSLFRAIKIGNSSTMYVGKDWDVINGIQRYMKYLIGEYSALANIIFVFHERDEKDRAESKPNAPAYTGQVTVDPQYLAETLSLFNEVYRITVNYQGKFEVTCRQNNEVRASTTMLLDATEPPNIQAMIQKHRAKRAELDGKK